jgi:hypothetical protein
VLSSIITLRPENVVAHAKAFHGIYAFLEHTTRQIDLGLIFLRLPHDRANIVLELVI